MRESGLASASPTGSDVLGGSVGPAAQFPITPAFCPREREKYRPHGAKSRHPDISRDCRQSTLSLGGWGEGERGRRTDAAAQYVLGPRETALLFLAALASNVRAPITQGGGFGRIQEAHAGPFYCQIT